jgi:regulator of cell morphogenesis and NO signaling
MIWITPLGSEAHRCPSMTHEAIESSMLVRDLLREHPTAVVVLDRYRIDWCCGAGRALEEACSSAGVTVAQVREDVAQAEAQAGLRALDVHRFETMPLTEVIGHVEVAHHGFTRSEAERLCALATKVAKRHGEAHDELVTLERAVHALFAELLAHMDKEERVLFPAIRDVESGRGAPVAWLAAPIAVMKAEHEHAGAQLAQIAALTDNFRPPPAACASWRALYDGLLEHDADLRHHVWLENEIVFPRGLALMQACLAGERRQA